jgi:hypothetical protein
VDGNNVGGDGDNDGGDNGNGNGNGDGNGNGNANMASRMFGNNVGAADGITTYDHRASHATTESSLQWLLTAAMLLFPIVVEDSTAAIANANIDLRDMCFTIAGRATRQQIKVPFYALSQRNTPVNAQLFYDTINEVMDDIYNPDWVDDVYQRLVDPDEQAKRETVSDVVTRQKDIIASYTWALSITGQPPSADLDIKAGRGLLKALPAFLDRICSATAHMSSTDQKEFKTIEQVAKSISRNLQGQARKRKIDELVMGNLNVEPAGGTQDSLAQLQSSSQNAFEEQFLGLSTTIEARIKNGFSMMAASRPAPTRCFFCGEEGHWASACPHKNPPIKCSICEREGHSDIYCPVNTQE